MRHRLVLLVPLVVVLAGSILGRATADNSSLVNPFEQQGPAARGVSAQVSDETGSEGRSGFSFPKLSMPTLPKPSLPKWQMPKLGLPQLKKPAPTRTAEPSMWQKVNQGTKNMMAKTRDTLMPWTVDDERPAPRHATGNRHSTGTSRTRVASNRNNEPTESRRSFLPSFGSESEPAERRIESTNDFLSLPRPSFN